MVQNPLREKNKENYKRKNKNRHATAKLENEKGYKEIEN